MFYIDCKLAFYTKSASHMKCTDLGFTVDSSSLILVCCQVKTQSKQQKIKKWVKLSLFN